MIPRALTVVSLVVGLLRCGVDCGEHGVCTGGQCFCRSPFTGPRCDIQANVDSGHWYATVSTLQMSAHPAPAAAAEPTAALQVRTVDYLKAQLDRLRATADAAVKAALAGRPPPQAQAQVAPTADRSDVAKAPPQAQAHTAPTAKRSDEATPPGVAPQFSADAVGHNVVPSVPLQTKQQPFKDNAEVVMDGVKNANIISNFILNAGVVLVIIFVICAACFLVKSNKEASSRVMFAVSGDTKLRANAADFMGASVLPSSVIRIERIILHDLASQMFEALDVFVEVDFGTNMIATTRVRNVQPVGAMDAVSTSMNTLPVTERPRKNRVVFTDKLEFNVRPFAESNMVFRVKDQDVIGNDLLGTVEVPLDIFMAKAKENSRSGAPLNYNASLSFPLQFEGKPIDTRLLVWFSEVDWLTA